jgi:hypothetical protein
MNDLESKYREPPEGGLIKLKIFWNLVNEFSNKGLLGTWKKEKEGIIWKYG